MTGIRLSSLCEFLSILQIDHQTTQYMKEDSIELLAEITNEKWTEEVEFVCDDLNSKDYFDASFDEQHSRPQRFTYGHAPYATSTLMDGGGRIIHLSHVDPGIMESSNLLTKAGSKCKSKAKVAHTNGFIHLRDNFTSTLRFLTADQSADGKSDAETILRSKWPNFIMNFDLWHKTYPMTAEWKKFVNLRSRKYGPYKYPFLHDLWSSKLLNAYTFKKWWINCSNVCFKFKSIYLFNIININRVAKEMERYLLKCGLVRQTI